MHSIFKNGSKLLYYGEDKKGPENQNQIKTFITFSLDYNVA